MPTTHQAVLSQVNIYPIKSSAGINLTESRVEAQGLAFDRRFVLTDLANNFITGRTQPKIALICCQLTLHGLILSAPSMPNLIINYQDFSVHYKNIQLWQDTINAQHCSAVYDVWFSHYLNTPCHLLYFGEKSQRLVKHYQQNDNVKLSFADGYPLMLISQASLDDLNHRLLQTTTNEQVLMSQFRPNLVINNTLPFAEDGWQRIRIGEVDFEIIKPCSRCIFTTIDPKTAEKHRQQQPLATLKKYRTDEDKKEIMFGQNLIALNQGQICVGDHLEIISHQTAKVYVDNMLLDQKQATSIAAKENHTKKILNEKRTSYKKSVKKKVTILFDSWDKYIIGNNQQTLLEQGEAAGLILAYSCRAGLCGRCKVKLESGEVEQLATDGLDENEKQQGYILACSCVPKTNVVINKS